LGQFCALLTSLDQVLLLKFLRFFARAYLLMWTSLFRNESYTSYGSICLCISKYVTLKSFVKEDHKVENVATEIAGQNSELD
jgi:hypothetical protein